MSVVDAVRTLADMCHVPLRPFDLTREEAAELLEKLPEIKHLRSRDEATADEVVFLVLGQFEAELPTEYRKDHLVAEAVAALDEPKPRRWRDREGDEWDESGDRLRLAEPGVVSTTDRVFVENAYGPLVEVVPQPSTEQVQ
jgi:hypothetical protein